MNFVLLFFAELFLLFLISKQLTIRLSIFFHRVTRSTKATIYLLALLYFPGTLIHELSHVVMAGLLMVRVTHMELFPKVEGQHVKLGTVSIIKPDIFRNLLIGMAPFFFGTTLLLALLFWAVSNNLLNNPFIVILIGYAVFEIGNTMFSSKKDMEGALEIMLALFIIVVSLYFTGFRIPAINPEIFFQNPTIATVFQKGTLFLLAPLGIDILLILLLALTKKATY